MARPQPDRSLRPPPRNHRLEGPRHRARGRGIQRPPGPAHGRIRNRPPPGWTGRGPAYLAPPVGLEPTTLRLPLLAGHRASGGRVISELDPAMLSSWDLRVHIAEERAGGWE